MKYLKIRKCAPEEHTVCLVNLDNVLYVEEGNNAKICTIHFRDGSSIQSDSSLEQIEKNLATLH